MTSLLPFGGAGGWLGVGAERGRASVLGPGDSGLGSSFLVPISSLVFIPRERKVRSPARSTPTPRPFLYLPLPSSSSTSTFQCFPDRSSRLEPAQRAGRLALRVAPHPYTPNPYTPHPFSRMRCGGWRRRRDLSQLRGAGREVITTPTSHCAAERLTTRRGEATPSSYPRRATRFPLPSPSLYHQSSWCRAFVRSS